MLQVIRIDDNRKGALVCPSGYALPPFIVMERGESLDRWSERAKPDVWQSVSVRTYLLTVRAHSVYGATLRGPVCCSAAAPDLQGHCVRM